MKSLAQKLKFSKEREMSLEAEIESLKLDREKFRNEYVSLLKWFIELHGKNSSPSLPYLIERVAKFMTHVERWYW